VGTDWNLLDLGTAEYESVLDLQHRLVRKRVAGAIGDTLVLVEHPHVITLGRRADASNVLNAGPVPVVRVERGGDVTYHGPGQAVAYPVVSLGERGADLRRFVRDLEDGVIEALSRYGIMGKHLDKKPGVWVDDAVRGERKIASVGVAVSHWVTYHGVALNVNTDLGHFQRINPCGYGSDVMTSMAQQVRQRVVFEEAKEALAECLSDQFGAGLKAADPAELADGWPAGEPVPSVDSGPAGHPAGATPSS
jgi:lipoate-protein ligase B